MVTSRGNIIAPNHVYGVLQDVRPQEVLDGLMAFQKQGNGGWDAPAWAVALADKLGVETWNAQVREMAYRYVLDAILNAPGVMDDLHRQIETLRKAMAYEAEVVHAHLDYKSFPKTRREIAEKQVKRMQNLAAGKVDPDFWPRYDRVKLPEASA